MRQCLIAPTRLDIYRYLTDTLIRPPGFTTTDILSRNIRLGRIFWHPEKRRIEVFVSGKLASSVEARPCVEKAKRTNEQRARIWVRGRTHCLPLSRRTHPFWNVSRGFTGNALSFCIDWILPIHMWCYNLRQSVAARLTGRRTGGL